MWTLSHVRHFLLHELNVSMPNQNECKRLGIFNHHQFCAGHVGYKRTEVIEASVFTWTHPLMFCLGLCHAQCEAFTAGTALRFSELSCQSGVVLCYLSVFCFWLYANYWVILPFVWTKSLLLPSHLLHNYETVNVDASWTVGSLPLLVFMDVYFLKLLMKWWIFLDVYYWTKLHPPCRFSNAPFLLI